MRGRGRGWHGQVNVVSKGLGRAVEFAATFVAAESVEVSPIHCCLRRREVCDVGDWGGRVDCLRRLGFKKFGLKFPRCKMNRRKAQ